MSITFAAESRKTRENAWFSQRFKRIEEKRAKANLKNEGSAARRKKREKRIKTRGFLNLFKERARGKRRKSRRGSAAPRHQKRVKTRGFRIFFRKNDKKRPKFDKIRKSRKTHENAWFWTCSEPREAISRPPKIAKNAVKRGVFENETPKSAREARTRVRKDLYRY